MVVFRQPAVVAIKKKMKTENTYIDKGKTKWYYISRIEVVCPNCTSKATLLTPNENLSEPELKCSNCYYSKTGFEYSTFSNIQKIVCEKCNSIFNIETKDLLRTVKKTNCKCPDCEHQNQVEVEFDLYKNGGMYNQQTKDQYFGLDFWYMTNFKSNSFWAYNLDHLNEIEYYVSAKKRKRHLVEYQSMVEKLPKWVSSKKNRDEILNAITKLKRKTAENYP
jgi:transposase-like protein